MARCRRDQLTRDQPRGGNLPGEHATSRWTVASRTRSTGGWRRSWRTTDWGLFEVVVERVFVAACLRQVEEGEPYLYELFMLWSRAALIAPMRWRSGSVRGDMGSSKQIDGGCLLSQDEMWRVLAGLSTSGWTGRDFAWFFWRRGIPARAWLVCTPWRGERGGPCIHWAPLRLAVALLKSPGPSLSLLS